MGFFPLLIPSRNIISKPINANLSAGLNICGLLGQKKKKKGKLMPILS